MVLEVSDPHPLAGLRLNVTPAFLESLVSVAVTVTAAAPASIEVEPVLLARLTLIFGLLPPQPQIMESKRTLRRSRITLCTRTIEAPEVPDWEPSGRGAREDRSARRQPSIPLRGE